MENIGPALAELRKINKLSSAARLRALGALQEDVLQAAEAQIAALRADAEVLATLQAAAPPTVRRKQLYARVVAWIHEDERAGATVPVECPVCGASLTAALDRVTGRAGEAAFGGGFFRQRRARGSNCESVGGSRDWGVIARLA